MSLFNDPIEKKLITARVGLLWSAAFFGHIATRLGIVDASKWCKTIATDGKNFYYNRDYIKSVSDTQLVFLLAHSVLHCVYDHLGRRGGRNRQIWDMATDYIVNYTLVKEGLGTMPPGGLFNEKYTDAMSSEEVYRLLEQNSTKIETPLDEHLDLDGTDGNGEGGQGSASVTIMGDGNGPPKLSDDEIEDIRNSLKAAVINAAQAAGAGNVPLGIRRMIDEFTTPVMDWKSMLEAHIKSAVKEDYTFSRPSRRSWSADGSDILASVIMPGQDLAEKVNVAVAVDTSGSMTDEMLRDFLSEVRGIMEAFEDFELWLWTFDHEAYQPKKFTPNNLDELYNYDAKGGGGTRFESCWDLMRNPKSVDPDCEVDELVPNKFVMFTDGYPGAGWGDENYCDTLFVIHGNDKIVAPFGQTAYYDNNK